MRRVDARRRPRASTPARSSARPRPRRRRRRRGCHVGAVPAPVHHHVRHPGLGDQPAAIAGSARPPLTSLTSAAPAASAARPPRPHGVDADRHARPRPARGRPGATRRSSSSALTRCAPGRVDSPPTSTMSAPCGGQLQAVLDRRRRVEPRAAVGERVRRDVDDAHDQAAGRPGRPSGRPGARGLTRPRAVRPAIAPLLESPARPAGLLGPASRARRAAGVRRGRRRRSWSRPAAGRPAHSTWARPGTPRPPGPPRRSGAGPGCRGRPGTAAPTRG